MTFYRLLQGDMATILPRLNDESVDLIYTDPPYLKSCLYLYKILADESPRVMKDGASLVTIVGHYALPTVMKYFDGKLKYRWILCMNQFDGSHARMLMGIEVMWKPMLWYVKRAYPQGRGFLRDGILISGRQGIKKKLHKWQQDESWAQYYIKKLTKKNDLVLDPFLGSGTVMKVCQELKRSCIGIEIDPKLCKIVQERCNCQIEIFKNKGGDT